MNSTLGPVTYYKNGRLNVRRTAMRRLSDYVKQSTQASGVPVKATGDVLKQVAEMLR